MNEELLAAIALLVQSGALLVSPYGFINFLQLSNVIPTQVCSAPALSSRRPSYVNNIGGTKKGIKTSILPLKRSTDY
jgi:hypothetical protein